MSRIVWDKTGERFYETGVDRAVLYPISSAGLYNKGVPWNGITGITESPSGAEPNNLYADNIKYLVLVGAEDFGLTVEITSTATVTQGDDIRWASLSYTSN